MVVALAAKSLILTGGYSIYAVSTILSNEIWFVLGMSICAFNVQLKGRKVQGMICGVLFIILSIMVYTAEISSSAVPFVMGLLACVAVIMMVVSFEEKFGRGMKFIAVHNADFFDAYVVCGTDEIYPDEDRHRKCCDSCSTGTWNKLCRSDYGCLDYEENKVAGIFLVLKQIFEEGTTSMNKRISVS
ncbi:hypothetical protein [Anaerolactibacter massiliensis]|uniref:hypothetical protein n=1 Tax=Anaerolactibacter massiliensis TaxID=2044573 RepID=UPI00195B0A6B|nr:hypothetical protein [Anaerolactibacter massiliensis]